MPDWLLKDENYIPQKDKDTFVSKSILSILTVLSKIKRQSNTYHKIRVNATIKVAFTLLLVILLSITKSFTFITIILVYLLVILSFMQGEIITKILKTSLIMSLFTFIILLPAALLGNGYSLVMITSKVFATITSVNILSHTTKWDKITSSFKRFFVPDIFIFVLDITIKYITMLGEFSLNMLFALKLRSVGKNKAKYTSLSGILGTMFLKSKEMAEETYYAMECRGFTGEYHVNRKFKMQFADILYVLVHISFIIIFIYLERN